MVVAATFAFFAALTAGFELGLLAHSKFIAKNVVNVGWRVVYMTPLANAMLFALIGAPLIALAARKRGLDIRIAVFVAASLMIACVLLLYEGLHSYAVAVLAVGGGVQLARMAAGRSGGFARLVQSGALVLGGALIVLGVAASGWQAIRERRALASLPPATDNAPNVLLLILDTVRAASLGLYGNARPTTPEIERLAQRGVVFDRAIATAPWTLPSHVSLFTGRYLSETEAGWKTPLHD